MLTIRRYMTAATLLLILACLVGAYVVIDNLLRGALMGGAWLLMPTLLWVDRAIAHRLEQQLLKQERRAIALRVQSELHLADSRRLLANQGTD